MVFMPGTTAVTADSHNKETGTPGEPPVEFVYSATLALPVPLATFMDIAEALPSSLIPYQFADAYPATFMAFPLMYDFPKTAGQAHVPTYVGVTLTVGVCVIVAVMVPVYVGVPHITGQ
jgi:hypothetical protein